MQFGFWEKLPCPFFALAPMADVTDVAFREIIAKCGKFTSSDGVARGGPDVLFTEFVSCDGLCSRGKEKLLINLKFTEKQRPIVAQFFGANPDNFYKCALFARELKFDGIDINMGCPDRVVEKQGAGAALIKNPELAKKIIYETKRGAGKMPVSVKTRLGYNHDTLHEWLPHILETEPAVITIHARTRKEMSKAPAQWNRIADAVKIRDKYFSRSKKKPLIVGNGDVISVADGLEKAKMSGVNGVMVGRGILGNPWFFVDLSRSVGSRGGKRVGRAVCETDAGRPPQPTVEEKIRVMLEHAWLFEKYFGNSNTDRAHALKNFDVMKKHFKAYVSGFNGAKELRIALMKAKNANEVKNILEKNKRTIG